MSPEHEVIICYCIKCGLELGSFDNSWEGLGKTYYIPKVTRGIKGFKGVGTIKLANGLAQVGTVIENSALQDLSCAECREILGLRCDSAPENHLLKRDQLLLCAKKLRMESQQTGRKAVLGVTKTHDLKKSSNSSGSPFTSSILSHTTRPRDVSHQDIEKSFTPAVSLPPMLGEAALTSTIREQRKDIDRIDAAVGRLQKDIQDVKFFMEDVRREMREIRSTRPVAESMIDNLRTDVLHLGDKANEVDDMRSQLESLRTRIKDIEEAFRNAKVSKSRAENTPTASAEHQNVQMLRRPVAREKGHTRDLKIAESYRASRRKRRYSEAESNQMEDKVSNITNLKQHKRRRQPEFQQDESSKSCSSTPIGLSNEEASTPSQYRIESPILGRYNNNYDNDHTQQYDDQDMEHDNEVQIPESPSQQIATEMNTPKERQNNEKYQCLRDISRNTTNQIPESSQGTSPSPSQPSKIPPKISDGIIIDSSSEMLPGPGRALRRRTIPIPSSDSAAKPLVAEVPGTSGNDTTIELTGCEDGVTSELQRDGKSRIAQLGGQGKDENSTLAQEAEEAFMSHFINPTKRTRRSTRSSHHRSIVDFSSEDNVGGNLEVAGTSTLVEVQVQVKDIHSALAEDDIENTSQDLRPTKRTRRNTRSSRRRPSVDLDSAITSRTTATADFITIDDEFIKKHAERHRRSIGVSKETTSDDGGDHADIYTERRKGQQSERDYEREEENERGRAKDRAREQEKRRRSTRRKELERREELVKKALRLARDY
ncbi:hypothetical protein EYC84_011564 [Monilinia fructicola]|uniref:Yippee domain-containing protein n=1 Tax=Monilinia fructicola TaxID=38448 RepID=A0A5M9JAH5_MONFR|nr:hypothetical protein EYC84_011564 [Monilinia fructicola]